MLNFSSIFNACSCILSQYLWCNNYIKTYNKSIYFANFSKHNINLLSQLYDGSGNITNWTQFKNDYDLNDNFQFKWV